MAGNLVPIILGTTGGLPGVVVVGSWASERVRAFLHRNAVSFVDMLDELGHVTPQELTEALHSRPQAVELLVRAVDEASKTQQRSRQLLLASLVTAGLRGAHDGSAPDFNELYVLRGMADRLEDSHIQLLLIFEANLPRPDDDRLAQQGVKAKDLAGLWPQAAGWIPALLAVLVGQGLVEENFEETWDGIGDRRYKLAVPGRRLLNYYRLLDPQR